MGLSELKEIDDFLLFKKYIKSFILENESLYRLIWFSNSNPFDEDSCPYPEEPRDIFTASDEHGCVLFKRKNNIVLNKETVNILIDFESANQSYSYDMIYIIFRIVVKGENIQELSNGVNRSSAIAKFIDDEFNLAKINGLGEVKKQSFKELSLNEENVGYTIIFSAHSFSSDISSNKNFQKSIHNGW